MPGTDGDVFSARGLAPARLLRSVLFGDIFMSLLPSYRRTCHQTLSLFLVHVTNECAKGLKADAFAERVPTLTPPPHPPSTVAW